VSPRAAPGLAVRRQSAAAAPVITVEVGEILLHGLAPADPAAFGEAVRLRLAALLAARGLPQPGREAAGLGRLPWRDGNALAIGVAEAIWRRLPPGGGGS
jgi:hypothetical protein